jgi:hypothetical protein
VDFLLEEEEVVTFEVSADSLPFIQAFYWSDSSGTQFIEWKEEGVAEAYSSNSDHCNWGKFLAWFGLVYVGKPKGFSGFLGRVLLLQKYIFLHRIRWIKIPV